MNIVEIINLYNPKFSLNEESVIMVPIEYMDEIKKFAETHNAKLQIFQKRKGKYVYIKWCPGETIGGRE